LRDSFESGATFPLRLDACAATDLSTKANDLPARAEDLVTKAPSLPYPSLAPMTRSLTQHSTVTSPLSSVSDVVDTRALPRKSSRDVGIMDQLDDTTPSITRKTANDTQSYFDIEGSKILVFQTPHRSPTPPPIPESATVSSTHPSATCHGQLTPEIGVAEDIHKPVVGPVVVDVNGAAPEAEADS